MAPLFVTWVEGLSTKTVGEDLCFGLHVILGQKPAKFEWRPLFFWSSPNFGQENGLGFGLENFHSGFHYSQYSQIFWPPSPFSKILRTLVVITSLLIHQVALVRRQRRDLSVFESSCHLSTTHSEAFTLPFYC